MEAVTLHRAELALARDPAMARALGRPPVLPVLDGVVLKVWPRDGQMAGVPLLIGTTLTEGTFWYDLVGPDGQKVPGLAPPRDMAQLETMIRDLAAIYRPEAVDRAGSIAPLYVRAAAARGAAEGPLAPWVDAYTDIVFRLRARTAAARHADAGHAAWLYEFAHSLAPPAHGVPHTSEIPFVFGTYADPFFAAKVGSGVAERGLSDFLLGTWARFAHEGRAEWAEVSPRGMVEGHFGGTIASGLAIGAREPILTAWGVP